MSHVVAVDDRGGAVSEDGSLTLEQVGNRVEWALVRAGFANPRAFISSAVTFGHFDDKKLGQAWRIISALGPGTEPGTACERGNFTAEAQKLGIVDLAGFPGNRFLNDLIGGGSPPDARYATAQLVTYLHKRYQLRAFKLRTTLLVNRVDVEGNLDGQFSDWVIEARRVTLADYSAGHDASAETLLKERPGSNRLIPLCLPEVDIPVGGGLAPGDLVFWGGGTNDGKSYAVLAVCVQRSKAGRRTAYISVEDSATDIRARVLSHYCGIAPASIIASRPEIKEKIKEAESRALVDLKDRWFTRVARKATISQIAEMIRYFAHACGCDVVVVDYVQAIRHDDPEIVDKKRVVPEAIDTLKACADECGVVLVITSQYARENTKAGAEPQMTDLKYSGDAENNSEAVILMWRDPEGTRPRLLHTKIAKLKRANVDTTPRYIVDKDPNTGWHRAWNIDDGPVGGQSREDDEPRNPRGGGGGRGNGNRQQQRRY